MSFACQSIVHKKQVPHKAIIKNTLVNSPVRFEARRTKLTHWHDGQAQSADKNQLHKSVRRLSARARRVAGTGTQAGNKQGGPWTIAHPHAGTRSPAAAATF